MFGLMECNVSYFLLSMILVLLSLQLVYNRMSSKIDLKYDLEAKTTDLWRQVKDGI